MSVRLCVCIMCFLVSLLHIHAFPWGSEDRLLWESEGEREEDGESERKERWRLGAGACVGRLVSVEVWRVPKDLGGPRGAGGGRRCGRGEGLYPRTGTGMPGGQSSSAHTQTHTLPFPVFLIIPRPPRSRLCRSRCPDPAAGEELEKYALCLYCGKSLIQVTHIHSPGCVLVERSGRGGEKKKGGWTKEQKQRSALFEMILSCTSYFSLLLQETQTDTFMQALCCGDSGFKAERVSLWARMRKYNRLAVTQEPQYSRDEA